ncbi:MAG: TlpA family protein disulfide reductase [Cyclobacteriaceae bacterium]|nr:TlpA family protein disulfide reductase [Cyclobacteriaceae bacterium]
MTAEKNKGRKVRREIIEWAVIIGIGLVLYLTGLHTQVIGTLQGLVLKTGIIKPDTSPGEVIAPAEYNFKLVDQEGRLLEGSSLEGEVVFMNFWATWCPPCIAEMPDINRLYGELQEESDIRFILVSLDEDFNKAIEFVKERGYDFDIYQFASPVPMVYESRAIPTTFVLSPEGEIVVKKEGMAKYNSESFRNFLRSLK